ncbi:hypothetical protein VNO77_23573 [Canavalia gladiata]|uniref:Uncharacterized protein n=1 Tax=Canavalia gladiata TaxID=3824 RepID=A0AAN9QBM6_CANGL
MFFVNHFVILIFQSKNCDVETLFWYFLSVVTFQSYQLLYGSAVWFDFTFISHYSLYQFLLLYLKQLIAHDNSGSSNSSISNSSSFS